MSINIATLSGNTGSEPEVRESKGGNEFATFSLAFTRWDGKEEQTCWIDVVMFGGKVNLAPYIGKGTQVTVSGPLSIRDFEREDGSKGRNVSIVANEITLGRNTIEPEEKPAKKAKKKKDADNSLPF